jgi:hypothetical protein
LYVDNGCSKNMTGDKKRFLTLEKERDGSISFGNNHLAKIIGRGTAKHGRKYSIGRRYETQSIECK